MKNFPFSLILSFAFSLSFTCSAFALPGDMGFFGGISEGRRLPKTSESIAQANTGAGNRARGGNANQTRTFPYKEVVFLSGRPVEFTGLLDVSGSNGATPNSPSGNYVQMMRVYPSGASDEEVSINRNIVYTVSYRREGKQLIKDYSVRDWDETITVGGVGYNLDRAQSGFDVSIIEHETPGVAYYRGDVSSRSVYSSGGSEGMLVLDVSDSFYGYSCAWSGAEAHRLNAALTGGYWQMLYQVRPGLYVNKTLWYTENEPEAISFDGNYKEVYRNQSGLKYNISQPPLIYPDQPLEGGASIPMRNTFEQLPAPDVGFLKGHPAMEDIRKLFSMRILDGNPRFYLPDQAITRAQFVTALAKAINLPIENAAARRGRAQTQPIVFPDVQPSRPDYPYIMSAYRNGVAIGRDDGTFYADTLLERQEAFVVAMRALGVASIGGPADIFSAFSDDGQIAEWARPSTVGAYRLGLIKPSQSGEIRPKDYVSKAEAAALLRSIVDYMRVGLASDYAGHIVDYAG